MAPLINPRSVRQAREALLEWYAPRRDLFPWRRTRDPYAIFVSEIMLQQTQASHVVPAFERFVLTFPTVGDLAAAPRSSVIRAWAGLGYNRRAVALSDAARMIETTHGGRVPRTLDALRSLPGVGPYTAAAVASIAFGAVVPAIDTNVSRVVSRVSPTSDAVDAAGVRVAAAGWIDPAAPGEWNQAIMDLGREVCRATPRCERCPLTSLCRFARGGERPRAARRRSEPFEGSFRQVRGDVVRVLRARPSVTVATLSRSTRHPPDVVAAAVAALAHDGLVDAGASALGGSPRGRVRLRS